MASEKLTDSKVKSAKAKPGERLELFDSQVPGLLLRVSEAGTKSWFIRYRTIDGRQPRLALGVYDDVTLADAREQASEVKRLARKGEDPAADRRRAVAVVKAQTLRTFGDLAEAYLAAVKGGTWTPRGRRKRPSTIAGEAELYARHLKPRIGGESLRALTRPLLKGVFRDIADIAPIQSNRCFSLARQILNYGLAEHDGAVTGNPMLGLSPVAEERARERVLSEAELRQLLGGLQGPAELRGRDGKPLAVSRGMCIALELVLILLQRRSEVAGMAVAELDLDAATWLIPAARTKNGQTHLVPLPPRAVQLIREAIDLRRHGGPFVFPSPRDAAKPITSGAVSYALRKVYAALGVKGATLHDLRRTGASAMASERLGVAPHVVSRVLNHSDAGGGSATTARHYNVYGYAPEKRRALEAWSGSLEGLTP